MDVERCGWKLHETPPFASGIFQLATFDDTGGSTELIFWMDFGWILDGFWYVGVILGLVNEVGRVQKPFSSRGTGALVLL